MSNFTPTSSTPGTSDNEASNVLPHVPYTPSWPLWRFWRAEGQADLGVPIGTALRPARVVNFDDTTPPNSSPGVSTPTTPETPPPVPPRPRARTRTPRRRQVALPQAPPPLPPRRTPLAERQSNRPEARRRPRRHATAFRAHPCSDDTSDSDNMPTSRRQARYDDPI
jgi:hypothetical protein